MKGRIRAISKLKTAAPVARRTRTYREQGPDSTEAKRSARTRTTRARTTRALRETSAHKKPQSDMAAARARKQRRAARPTGTPIEQRCSPRPRAGLLDRRSAAESRQLTWRSPYNETIRPGEILGWTRRTTPRPTRGGGPGDRRGCSSEPCERSLVASAHDDMQ